MRMGGKILIAAALLALPAHAADLNEPSLALINASATRVDFADQHAHLAKSGFVNFNIVTVLADSDGYALSQVSLNCSSKQIATLSNANYSAKGAVLPTPAVDVAPQPIAAGTLGQALQTVVCNGADPYPRAKPITSIPAALTKAHDLMAALKANPAK